MPVYTKRELAQMFGVKTSYITTYVKRGNIVLNENGYVDTSLPMNADFVNKRTIQNIEPEEVKPKKQSKQKNNSNKLANEPSEDALASQLRKYELDQKLKELDLEKKIEDLRRVQLQNAKLSGEAIPVDAVKLAFMHHFRSISTSFHNAAEGYISIVVNRLGGNREDISFIRTELIDLINQAVREGVEQSKDSVDNIIKEYSEKRGRGESK